MISALMRNAKLIKLNTFIKCNHMGYTVEIKNDITKRKRTFIASDGTVHEGGFEAYLGGTGQADSLPEGSQKDSEAKKE